jgi:hypothetical protein
MKNKEIKRPVGRPRLPTYEEMCARRFQNIGIKTKGGKLSGSRS